MQNYGGPRKCLRFWGKEEQGSGIEFSKKGNDLTRTLRRRAKCKIKRRKRSRTCYVFLAMLAAVAIITSFVRAANVEYTTREVIVQEGDTLWSIWEEVGCSNYHKWKYEVQEMNGMETADIMAYQRLTVPVIK